MDLARLILAGAVVSLFTNTGLSQTADVLDNGGFEQGMVGWSPDAGHSVTGVNTRTGTQCLTGSSEGPRKALFLRRKVTVEAGNLYRFQAWARATNHTKLVLWAVLPGKTQRELIAAWERVPAQWKRYEATVPVRVDGELELIIVAPSSHNAPDGQIWLDDVALLETRMPPIVSVSGDDGFNDEPTLARAADGTVYVAWNQFRDGADSLQVARYRHAGGQLERLGQWQIDGGKGFYLLSPQAVADDRGATIVYAAERDGNWDVYATRCTSDGPAPPVRITSDAAVDVDPAVAWHDGSLWIAWEANQNGVRQIMVASCMGQHVSEPAVVSSADGSSYDPSIAVLADGQVCVAWHSFLDDNYDIYLARWSHEGELLATTRLTTAPQVDRNAQLAAAGDTLYLAYEHARIGRYNIGATNFRRLIVARVERVGLVTPKLSAPSPLTGRCEAASLVADDTGRLWLAYLRPRLPRTGWDAVLTCLAGDRWQPPRMLSTRKGMDRPPALAVGDGSALLAFQADDLPNSWSDVDHTLQAVSNVYLAAAEAPPAVDGAAVAWQPIVESDEPCEAATLRHERGEDQPQASIDYQGKSLKLYFGDLHEHTDVSICNRLGDQSVDESYQHMRDIARHDFACATDHGYNINPYLWNYLAKQARTNDDPDRFLTFLGEEWTSSFEEYDTKHPYGFYGHRNLILGDPYFPRWWNARNRQTPAELWEDLRRLKADFVNIPHQLADTGNVPTDWDFTDEQAQPAAEIFQTRGSYEYDGTPRQAKRTTPNGYFLQDAWARGIVIGVIASPDHGGGYGKAAVFAPELTRESILAAIRARHCYGTTGAKIFLDLRVEGRLMGEKVAAEAPETVRVEVVARCPRPIARIEICRNNRFIFIKEPGVPATQFTYVDRQPLPDRSYYYVRAIQDDEEIAWSSPVWFGAK